MLIMLFSLSGCGEKAAENEEITINSVIAPNGESLERLEEFGTSMVRYAGTTVPEGLGLPLLTDEEIDKLLADNDPRKVKETITTVADFINYCYRGHFVFADGLVFPGLISGEIAMTTCSGYQTLLRREGQCASMSSCFHYVLDGDYDEVGYVHVDGHLMTYVLSDGLYYLVNPADYVFYKGDWAAEKWLGYLFYGDETPPGDGFIVCADNFQDIADSMIEQTGCEPYTVIYTVTSPGDFVGGNGRFPVGTNAVCWYGTESVEYFWFVEHDWVTQENIVDENAIVMYGPDGNDIFPYGGTHLDVDTGKMWENTRDDVPEYDFEEKDVVLEYMKEIGAVTYSNKELKAMAEAGDIDEIYQMISTAEDFAKLIVCAEIKEGEGESIDEVFDKKQLYAEKIIEFACRALEGDYQEMGVIKTFPDMYYFLYTKQDGIYCAYDVLKVTYTELECEKAEFENLDDMINYAIDKRGVNSAETVVWP